MPKKFISSLLTAILALSHLPNQSAGAMKNINNSSSMIHKSNDKKLISSKTTLKKLKVPLVTIIGGVLIVGGTSFIIHRIRNAKTIEEIENIVSQAFEDKENITLEDFINIVNDIFQKLKEKKYNS